MIIKQPSCSLKAWKTRTKYCSLTCRARHVGKRPSFIRKQRLTHLGVKHSAETKRKKSEAQRGEKGSNWRGDNVGYTGIHEWLAEYFGKADHCENLDCHYPRKGAKKMLLKPWRHEWALLKGKTYQRRRENFIQLCVSCHRQYDTNSSIRLKPLTN